MFAAHEMRHVRRAAGGDQDVLCRERLVAGRAVGVERGQGNAVRAGEAREAVEHGDARAAQQVAVDAVEALISLRAVGFEGGPVEGGLRAFPAEAVGLFEGLGVVRRVAVELLRDAAHVHAGAAQAIGAEHLGQRHARTALRGHARGAHAAAAAADHEEVKVESGCGHGGVFPGAKPLSSWRMKSMKARVRVGSRRAWG